MLNKPGPEGIAHLRDLALKYSEELSKRARVGIRIDLTIIDNVFFAAANSIRFHNVKLHGQSPSANHYKQAAHITFWFQKFKPLRFIAPTDTRSILAEAFDKFATLVFGDAAQFEREYKSVNADYKRAKGHPINECVALLIAKNMIASAQHHAASALKGQKRIAAQAAIADVHARFEEQIVELTNALRYHNFTARSFATMIEHLFKVQDV